MPIRENAERHAAGLVGIDDTASRPTVEQRFGDVVACEPVGAGQIGDRARDADDPVEAARASGAPLHHAFEESRRGGVERGVLA